MTWQKRALGCVAGMGLMAITACSSGADSDEVRSEVAYQPVALTEASQVDEVVAATTLFGTQALAELADGENAVLSPASILVALAMLAEGADGPAAAELNELLGATGDDRSDAFSALLAQVLAYDGDPEVVQSDELPQTPLLHVANQLALGESSEPDEVVMGRLAQYFDAGVVRLDFAEESSKDALDAWVSEHTGGLIEESAIHAPDADLVFVLQNAILMAAQWQHQFQPSATSEQDFTTSAGETVEVEMMHQVLDAGYTEHDGAQVIRLPYTEGFAMDVVLPEGGAGGEDAGPGSFSAEDWAAVDEAFASGDSTTVELSLPQVDIASSQEMVPLLHNLGYSEVVAGDDLSAFDESVELSQIAHQAVLVIDEEGTVAAATTEIAGVTSAPMDPPEAVEMTVDRPFALRIVHQDTNWPLFMAAIDDPS